MTIHGREENVQDGHVDPAAREGMFDAQLSFDTPQVASPQPIAEILKRDGRRVPFEQQKIAIAIGKAGELVDAGDADEAAGLAAGVSLFLSKRLDGDAVTAQQVQDAVERVLMEMGRGRVALAYARYRDRRARIRDMRAGNVRSILNELREAERHTTGDSSGKGSSLSIRTSDERLAAWDRERIVTALIRETRMAGGMARLIALEVEKQIESANVTTLTTTLVRELVDAKLVEHGLESYRRKHMRLGVPLYDAEQIICVPNHGEHEGLHDPATTDVALAARVKKEFALAHLFSERVTDAHLSGDLHIHDIGRFDRLDSAAHSLAFVSHFGAYGNAQTSSSPPQDLHGFVGAWGQRNAALLNHTADRVHWFAANHLLAPHCAGYSEEECQRVANDAIMALLTRRGTASESQPSTSFELAWETPGPMAKTPTPRGTGPRRYEDFQREAQRLFHALIGSLRAAAPETALNLPEAVVTVTHSAMTSKAAVDRLRDVAGDRTLRPHVTFRFVRHASEARGSEPLWSAHDAVVHRVTLNLPRAALRARTEDNLYAELERTVELAVSSAMERAQLVDRLLSLRDLGPWSVLTHQHNGSPYCAPEHMTYAIGLTGLNECVQLITGHQLHESEEAQLLAERILERINESLRDHENELGLLFQLQPADQPGIAQRLANADLDLFGDPTSEVIKADPLTQEIGYTPGVAVARDADLTPVARVTLEGHLHDFLGDPACTALPLTDWDLSPEGASAFIQKVFYRTRVRRLRLTER